MAMGAAAVAAQAETGPGGELRLLHHMARSGGTLIAKCLGCMSDVVLLSEIHPLGTRYFNPLHQAQVWHGLIDQPDVEALAQRGAVDFAAAIGLIDERARARGGHLVLRDWSHLDFTGVPFNRPVYDLRLASCLRTRFTLRQLCTVRHPIDQWLSLSRLQVMQGHLQLGRFLHGYRRFAEVAVEIGHVRYEDFVAAPEAVMQELCARLGVPFDPGFTGRWSAYDRITGDVQGTRGGDTIQPVPRRPVDPALLAQFERNADYRQALELLGYRHPI